jgi:cytochrome oxidase Cu insertion factor (SCO1/SenC/PrrC family)/thiol-disulfide isomerase/thioredoxin
MRRSPIVFRTVPLVVLAVFAGVVAVDAAVTLHRADALRSAPAGTLPDGQALDRRAPPLPLLDEGGRATSLEAFRGRYVVMAPFLTLCHETCPLTIGALMRIQAAVRHRGLERRVAVVAASVDPWRDSPARLRAFRRRTGSGLHILTGTPAQLRRLWRFFGVGYHRVPEGDPPDRDWWTHRAQTFDVTHTEGLFIVDPRGHWRALVPGIADLGGRLPAALSSLLNQEGRASLRTPTGAWTVPAALGDLWRVMGVPPEPRAASPATGPPPAALAALHADAGRLLGGGGRAFRRRLAALRGHPVVVNAWASWCPPCRSELPLFATAARRFGGRVAFVGLDVSDADGRARAFLAGQPVGYPSYSDVDGAVARSLGAPQGLPVTLFLDANGRVFHVHAGAYASERALGEDVGVALGRVS